MLAGLLENVRSYHGRQAQLRFSGLVYGTCACVRVRLPLLGERTDAVIAESSHAAMAIAARRAASAA